MRTRHDRRRWGPTPAISRECRLLPGPERVENGNPSEIAFDHSNRNSDLIRSRRSDRFVARLFGLGPSDSTSSPVCSRLQSIPLDLVLGRRVVREALDGALGERPTVFFSDILELLVRRRRPESAKVRSGRTATLATVVAGKDDRSRFVIDQVPETVEEPVCSVTDGRRTTPHRSSSGRLRLLELLRTAVDRSGPDGRLRY